MMSVQAGFLNIESLLDRTTAGAVKSRPAREATPNRRIRTVFIIP